MQIIVLNINPYKEKDGIVHAISSKETIDFLVKGLFGSKNKYNCLNINLARANVEMLDGKNYRYPVLKDLTDIKSPLPSKYSYETTSTLLFLSELCNKLLPSEEQYFLYDMLDKAIEEIKSGTDSYLVAFTFLFNALRYQGYEFNTHECVFCHSKKNIVSFSFEDGGFVCRDCLIETYYSFTNEELKALYDIGTGVELVQIQDKYSPLLWLGLIDKTLTFLQDSLGVRVNSFNLLK